MPDLRAAPTLNALWAGLLVEELVRQGVGLFCLAPGSRSTPLTLAVAAHPTARYLMHFDERGTAFAALGYARATGKPAVWITTSGTAVANGLPAAVEADEDGVPLILLTADRPPELRDTAANQTVRQPELFAPFARYRNDLAVPTAAIDPAYVLTTVAQAVARALGPDAGPVHLNAPFREPLAPVPDGSIPTGYLDGLAHWLDGDRPYTRYVAATGCPADAYLADLAQRLRRHERGLVVAGRLHTAAEGAAARRIADHLGWPLVADVGSQVRLGLGDGAVAHADLVLSSDAFRETHRPDAVLYLGGRALSKKLGQLLADARPDPLAVVRPDGRRFDPDHVVTDRVQADVEAFAEALVSGSAAAAASSDWLASWRRAETAVRASLRRELDDGPSELTEPQVARLVTLHLPENSGIVLAASMPVRDADLFGATDGPRVPVAMNRGASGIDGTVATAAGFARGLGQPVTLLIGDLALLHDLNSLALLRQDGQPPVVVVAVNNDGGGIFHFLPVAGHERFEGLFGTPHGLGFEHAAQLFGLDYAQPDSTVAFRDAFLAAHASGRSALIEVRTEREANRALHADLRARAAAAVDQAMGP